MDFLKKAIEIIFSPLGITVILIGAGIVLSFTKKGIIVTVPEFPDLLLRNGRQEAIVRGKSGDSAEEKSLSRADFIRTPYPAPLQSRRIVGAGLSLSSLWSQP